MRITRIRTRPLPFRTAAVDREWDRFVIIAPRRIEAGTDTR